LKVVLKAMSEFMETIKKNITLILGISIPILMILFVAGSVYLPRLFIKPQFNFLYGSGDDFSYKKGLYSVQDGRLLKSGVKQPEDQHLQPVLDESKLYIYDLVKNEAREISLAEAQSLNLDPSIKSPDGFEVVKGGGAEGYYFLPHFFETRIDYDTRYLSGHNQSRKLNLQLGRAPFGSFRFLGWIK